MECHIVAKDVSQKHDKMYADVWICMLNLWPGALKYPYSGEALTQKVHFLYKCVEIRRLC